MNRKRGKLDYTLRPFLVVAFLLHSLVPHQFAFALLKDCGPHTVEICDEHENSHAVMRHEDGTARTTTSNLSVELNDHEDSSHDSSHQIEEKVPWAVITANELSEYSLSDTMVVVSNYILPPGNGHKHQYSSLEPPGKSANLFYLETIRLLI